MKTKQATMISEVIEVRKGVYLAASKMGNTTKLARAWHFFTGTATPVAEAVGGRIRRSQFSWDYQAGEWGNPILLND